MFICEWFIAVILWIVVKTKVKPADSCSTSGEPNRHGRRPVRRILRIQSFCVVRRDHLPDTVNLIRRCPPQESGEVTVGSQHGRCFVFGRLRRYQQGVARKIGKRAPFRLTARELVRERSSVGAASLAKFVERRSVHQDELEMFVARVFGGDSLRFEKERFVRNALSGRTTTTEARRREKRSRIARGIFERRKRNVLLLVEIFVFTVRTRVRRCVVPS